MSQPAAPSKGTRPDGATSEADASRKVREMFTQIAPRYDLLNHLLSLQLDRVWRAKTARKLKTILDRSDAVVLDLCCGTGDLTFALKKKGKARVIGADFAHTMLVRANAKSAKMGGAVPFLELDALQLPFADESFDLVTAAFGFRNLANYEAGLREMKRILKPAGTIGILEFTEPPAGPFGDFYRWYFRKILPKVGGAISGDAAAYKYLPSSVARFFRPEELRELMRSLGLQRVEAAVWTGGTVALHTGIKGS
ncbi:MAG TPA: bifunctional demethylmenaquinone methyltransferase/2-methoxy-6-polyprenyl-1,4-benzoquinol methylase UbiE [Candidatus Acidoferrum sp.]|nr:bifunctional demethylmenaquinone methyltransferase/2-methoxy-6-polyprenyl-1,4-benzoquinol methylase UbiE [Candidatus Acidoferrum sp.]